MKKQFLFWIILLASVMYSHGQAIGIGSTVFTPDASAMLEVQATNKGLLIPRVSLTSYTDNTTIPNPATSLLVYNQGAAIPVGYYYNAGTPAAPQWVRILDERNAWLLTGNAGTNPANNFIGTTDAQPLVFRTNNNERMRILANGNVGIGNTAPAQRLVVSGNIGLQAGANAFIGTLDNFALSLRTNNTDRIFITNAGNVGIGTTTPTAQLHTTGTVRFANYASAANGAVLRTDNVGNLLITNFTGNANHVLLGNGTFGTLNAVAWLITGNSGTNPASNFLGTTDNQHLAIRTNNVERMRFQNNGQIVVNETTAWSTFLFDIEGSTAFANPLYVSTPVANGLGIVVENYAAAGTGSGGAIWGLSNQTGWATAAFGLRSSTAYQNAAVSGITGSDVANGIGVIGRCDHVTGTGVIGYNLSTTANINATGVWGQTPNPAGTGVVGVNNSTTANIDATGVWGQTSNPRGSGGYFINSAASGTSDGDGAAGITSQRDGFGLYGWNRHNSGTGIAAAGNNQTAYYLTNGSGGAFTGSSTGAYGRATAATGTGIIGAGNNLVPQTMTNGSGGAFTGSNTGVFGVATSLIGTGIVAAGNNQAPYSLPDGSGGAFTGATTGVYGYASNSGDNVWGGYFQTANANNYAWVGGRTGGTNYKINGPGSVATIVSRPDGTQANMFCPEAPEILFMDVGHAQLVNGKATVTFDPIFAHNIHVDEKHPLKVFIQLEGDCKGVYVTNKSQYGFEVVELQGGTSNVPFTWQAIAVRADTKDEQGNIISKHVGVRFPDAPKPPQTIILETQTVKEEKMRDEKIDVLHNKSTRDIPQPQTVEIGHIMLRSQEIIRE